MSGSQAEGGAAAPSPEELLEGLRRTRISDLLFETCSVIASLGYAKLDAEARDLDQARLAVEALKAIGPLLPDEQARDVRQVTANLQLAFAAAAAGPEPAGDD